MALTVKVLVNEDNTVIIRNKGNTVWNNKPLHSSIIDLVGSDGLLGMPKFFRAHLIQNPDYPQGKEIVLDEELESEDW